MKPNLIRFRVLSTKAKVLNPEIAFAKVNAKVNQSGQVGYGEFDDGRQAVVAKMLMNAEVIAEEKQAVLLEVSCEFEGIFSEMDPTITPESNLPPIEAAAIADFYISLLYSHGIGHVNRLFSEFGFGGVPLSIQFPLYAPKKVEPVKVTPTSK